MTNGLRTSGGFKRRLYPALPALSLAWALAGCGEPQGLLLGEVEIPYRLIHEAEQSLRTSFQSDGRATLIWHLLDAGLAEEALIHARCPAESAAALAEAERWADRARADADFTTLHAEWSAAHPELASHSSLDKPGPFFLGASVSARVAVLEPGEWAGPLRTQAGWEIVRLRERTPAPRAFAHVTVERLVFPVGSPEQHAVARADWAKLPLSGNPELLDTLPLEFRHGRLALKSAP